MIKQVINVALSFAIVPSAAFSPSPSFRVPMNLQMSDDLDLDFGMKNDYNTAEGADGGQGQFGAVAPGNWRKPGTSPSGETSYNGADDGGEEPWFSEAVSTVSLDLKRAETIMLAFTKEQADFKIENFAATKPYEFTTEESAMEELIKKLGYSGFLEATIKQTQKAWDTIHPKPKPPKKEKVEETKEEPTK